MRCTFQAVRLAIAAPPRSGWTLETQQAHTFMRVQRRGGVSGVFAAPHGLLKESVGLDHRIPPRH